MKQNSGRSLAMLVSAMCIWGTIGLFRKYIPLSSGLIAFSRGLIGAFFLAPLAKRRSGSVFRGPGGTKALRLVLPGAAMGMNWVLLFEAYRYTGVSVATLCYYMEPTFVILASAVLFREKLTAVRGLCAAAALTGMVLVSGVAGGTLPEAGEWRGIALGLGAAALYTAVVLLNKRTGGVDAYWKSVIQLASASAVLVPYLLLTENFSAITLSAGSAVMLLLVGVLHTGIAYALYFGSMDGLNTQTIAIFSYIDPIVALVLSAVVLSEKMSPAGIAGSVLILSSAVLSELKGRQS